MKTVIANARLVTIGATDDGPAHGAVFECSTPDGMRKLAPALGRDVELALTFTDPALSEAAGSGLGLAPTLCPCCKAKVYLATIQVPALMRVYVDLKQTEHVAEYDDGHLGIMRTYALHAPNCDWWPVAERDWRGNCS